MLTLRDAPNAKMHRYELLQLSQQEDWGCKQPSKRQARRLRYQPYEIGQDKIIWLKRISLQHLGHSYLVFVGNRLRASKACPSFADAYFL